MQVVPVQAVPNQTLQVQLNNQPVTVSLTQGLLGLFASVELGAAEVCDGVICLNRTRIVRAAYTGFVGDLAFVDTQGDADPAYGGLGSRYLLLYLEPGDY